MSCRSLISAILFASACVLAQTGQPATSPAAAGAQAPAPAAQPDVAASAAALPPETAVITLKNLCSRDAAQAVSPACTTVVTKADFERLVDAIVPKSRGPLPNATRQQFAKQLSNALLLSTVAEQRGLEKDPKTQQLLMISREQVLSQALSQKMLEESVPSAQEIETYYNQNVPSFAELTLQRLYIPKASPAKTKPEEIAAEKAGAQKLHDRAAAGEDMEKLEKEAFASSANPHAAPSTLMGPRRRGTLPPDQESVVFAMKPGSVSELLDNPAGWFVYKVISGRTIPLAEVNDEISRKLQQQKFTDTRNALLSSVPIETNEAYFGKEEAPPMPGMRNMNGMQMRPTGGPPAAAPPPPPPAPKPGAAQPH